LLQTLSSLWSFNLLVSSEVQLIIVRIFREMIVFFLLLHTYMLLSVFSNSKSLFVCLFFSHFWIMLYVYFCFVFFSSANLICFFFLGLNMLYSDLYFLPVFLFLLVFLVWCFLRAGSLCISFLFRTLVALSERL